MEDQRDEFLAFLLPGLSDFTGENPQHASPGASGMEWPTDPHSGRAQSDLGLGMMELERTVSDVLGVLTPVSAAPHVSPSSFPSTDILLLIGGKHGHWWLPDSPARHRGCLVLVQSQKFPGQLGHVQRALRPTSPAAAVAPGGVGRTAPRRSRGGG